MLLFCARKNQNNSILLTLLSQLNLVMTQSQCCQEKGKISVTNSADFSEISLGLCLQVTFLQKSALVFGSKIPKASIFFVILQELAYFRQFLDRFSEEKY